MTCVGCAKSIEKSLNQKSGVLHSAVNFAQSNVVVTIDPQQIDRSQIVETIRNTGFDVVEVEEGESLEDTAAAAHLAEERRQRQRLYIGMLFTVPLFLFSMAPRLSLDRPLVPCVHLNWILFGLATAGSVSTLDGITT